MRNLPAQTTEYGPGGSQSVLEQLLARIASGDREALGQLYHRTRSAVYALTLSYTKNAQDAEDLMQDTFVRVWDSAGQYRGRGSAMGWLLAIARNLALMKLREREQQGLWTRMSGTHSPPTAPALPRRTGYSRKTPCPLWTIRSGGWSSSTLWPV